MNLRSTLLSYRSLMFFLFLVSISIIGHYFPASGVLVIGALVAVSIEITRLRYKENTVATALIMFSTMTLFWGWIGPHIGLFARPAALLMFFSWGLYCLHSKVKDQAIRLSASGAIVLLIALVIFIQDSRHMISPLLWGYDNSAHIPALSQVFRHGGFLYSGAIPDLFTFGNYVHGYPPLQSSTWAFIMSITDVQLRGGYEILNYFGFFIFGTALLIISFISDTWRTGLSRSFTSVYQKITFLLVALLVAFSQASYIFWLGYPPFLWTCGIIIAIVKLLENSDNQSHRVLVGLLGLTLVNYSYPLLSPVLLMVLLLELPKMSRTDYAYLWIWRKLVGPFVLLGGLMNVAVVLKSLNVRHYLNDAGGIQPTELRNLMPIVAIVIAMGFVYKYSLKSFPIIVITFLASIINFGALAILSQRDQGSVSYYPQKAGYLALILGFASMGSMLSGSPRFSRPNNTNLVCLIAAATSIGALWFSVSTTSNPSYAKYGYISTSMVWDQLKHNPPNPSRDCFLRAMDITSDLNSNSNKQTILYLQDDLSTRWINGVRGRLTDATYSLSIPVGQGILTLPEILKGWFIQYPNAQLLILAPEPPIGLEQWSDRIEYRKFACV